MLEFRARLTVGASEAVPPCVDPSRSRKRLRRALRGFTAEPQTVPESGTQARESCSAPDAGLEPSPDIGLYWASGGAVLGNYP